MHRKQFIGKVGFSLGGLMLPFTRYTEFSSVKESGLKLSLSQWALHRAIFGNSKDNYQEWQRLLHSDPDQLWQGTLHPLDFPKKAKELGFSAIEYVNSLIFGHAKDKEFLNELKNRTDSEGIKNVLIMVDEEGFIGHPDKKERSIAIENHVSWMEASKHLGCPFMRINAFSMGPAEEQKKLAAEGLYRLAEKAKEFDLTILIENHGGMSSNADWLVETIELADHELLGTVVDFDNFTFSEDFIWGDGDIYNRYIGVEKLMPFAKSVSAKTHAFDIQGFETTIDYTRMMKLVKESGFNDYICVEYEGNKLSEEEGILATKALIEKTYAST
ncbi:MAG: sugar phosphate isomerase/epimerase family protein [Balneolaceae bacterium]